jgi:hypothetical protein
VADIACKAIPNDLDGVGQDQIGIAALIDYGFEALRL